MSESSMQDNQDRQERRKHRRKRAVQGLVVGVLAGIAAMAWAAWLTDSSGPGRGQTGTIQAVSVNMGPAAGRLAVLPRRHL